MFESWPEMWGGGYPAYRTTLRKFLWFRTVTGGNAPQYETVIGRIVSFLTRRAAPLKIEATLTPIQSGSGDPSPENIRPISGHTGCEIVRDGKNLATESSGNNKVVGKVKKGVTYTFSVHNIGAVGYSLKKNRQTGDTVVATSGASSDPVVSLTFTADDDFDLFLNGYGSGGGTFVDNASMYQLELGSTASEYEPYSGTSVTITFGQTVYGGTLTVNEDGTGSVKARPYYASYNGETLVGPWVSSMDAYAPGTTPTTGAQVVDMGGTETTIPLTPGQVEALQGNNTVWVDDSGEIKVTYRSN